MKSRRGSSQGKRKEEPSTYQPASLIPAVSELLEPIWTQKNERSGISERRVELKMDLLN